MTYAVSPIVTASVSDIATGRRPATLTPPDELIRRIASVGPLALPPPKTYIAEPSVVAPTSWMARGNVPTRCGVPGARRTTSATELSAESSPAAARTLPPARATPGSWTAAGSARVRSTRSTTERESARRTADGGGSPWGEVEEGDDEPQPAAARTSD